MCIVATWLTYVGDNQTKCARVILELSTSSVASLYITLSIVYLRLSLSTSNSLCESVCDGPLLPSVTRYMISLLDICFLPPLGSLALKLSFGQRIFIPKMNPQTSLQYFATNSNK